MDYIEAFKNLRTNNKYGRRSPHKAILMLAVIELYEQNVLTDNEIFYDEKLKSMFLKVWNRVLPKEPLFHPDAYLPFWYLQSDSFWHIIPIRGKEDILSLMRDANIKPSEAKLNDSVKCAELDDDLYFLMTIASGRSSLKRTLLETYTSLSEEQIDRLSGSVDNSVDHSLSAMNEYEQILSSTKKDDQELEIENSRELVQQFRKLNDDLQIALNYEYFSFLKNHRSERDMLREFCPNVFALYGCITNHPVQRTDISTSFAFIYENFLCDLKIALMSENGSMELIDKIEAAIEILRGNNVTEEAPESEGTTDVIDVNEKQEEPIENQLVYTEKEQDNFKIENTFDRCCIINNKGEKVFSSRGKLKYIGKELYRVNYSDSIITMNIIRNDGRGGFELGKKILNAHQRSPLYTSLDENKYLDQIKDVRIDYNTEEYHIQVDDRWYGNSGYYADFVQKENSDERAIESSEIVEETTVDNTYPSIDDSEIEHVYLDHRGKIAKIVSPAPKDTSSMENPIESRKGKTWTQEEEERITHYFERGIDTADIAERVGRTEAAIKARLAKLGLIEYTYGQGESDETSPNVTSVNPDDFQIKNGFTKAYILNKQGDEVYSTDGKLKSIGEKIYRLNLKKECFTIKDMQHNGQVWMKGIKKIVAYPWTELYKIMDDAYDYSEAIEDLFDSSSFEECKLKVNGVWYDYQGDMITDSTTCDDVTEESPQKHHDYQKIIKDPLYAVRKQALLRAMRYFRLPARIRDIARTISRTAWGAPIKEDDVEEIIKTISEIETIDGKYTMRKKY